MSFLLYLLNKGGIAMYGLFFCSILSLAIILERIIFFLRYKNAGEFALKKINDLNNEKNLKEKAKIFFQEEVFLLEKYLNILETIVTVAPLLGLLGMMLGIFHSYFAFIEAKTNKELILSKGITEALLTTIVGLVIAIFTLFFFSYFNYKKEYLIFNAEKNIKEKIWEKEELNNVENL